VLLNKEADRNVLHSPLPRFVKNVKSIITVKDTFLSRIYQFKISQKAVLSKVHVFGMFIAMFKCPLKKKVC